LALDRSGPIKFLMSHSLLPQNANNQKRTNDTKGDVTPPSKFDHTRLINSKNDQRQLLDANVLCLRV